MTTADTIINRVRRAGSADRADQARRYFKTGPGEYGEGDVFVGVRMPELRKLSRDYRETAEAAVVDLLASEIHEVRLLALLIMVQQARRGDPQEQARLYRLYLKHKGRVNNWDLVDLSAEHLVGGYLLTRSRDPLHKLSASRSLWDRRIAMLATFHFIKRDDFTTTMILAERYIGDPEDLMHKATGWMLREVGRRDRRLLENFLKQHLSDLPRTLLRYAIEHFPESRRQQYLRGTL
ncbi:MAG: DNA alkylation repair protein [Verrucomicrobia bacterium]|nr:DNA alkylation repair protein [Verrucomicrobiota bacterium]